MFWKIVAVVSFVAGVLVGALFLRPESAAPASPAARRPTTTTTICPAAGGGADTSVV
ncbi:MAG: hypothetical protein M3066_20120 [Actinomycetota bacterium]|nr:hypothetical protein [Actinomycetota bacterium]